MTVVCDLRTAKRERYHLIAFLLGGMTGLTATVTSVFEFVAVTGGPALALTVETTWGAS